MELSLTRSICCDYIQPLQGCVALTAFGNDVEPLQGSGWVQVVRYGDESFWDSLNL